jgi:hypothetical protein
MLHEPESGEPNPYRLGVYPFRDIVVTLWTTLFLVVIGIAIADPNGHTVAHRPDFALGLGGRGDPAHWRAPIGGHTHASRACPDRAYGGGSRGSTRLARSGPIG